MGSLIGSNQSGPSTTSCSKKVREITATASPKKLPNRNPQNVVEMPQKKNIRSDLFMLGSMFLNLSSAKPQPITIISPYAASESIMPNRI